jgi:hypothetical protein
MELKEEAELVARVIHCPCLGSYHFNPQECTLQGHTGPNVAYSTTSFPYFKRATVITEFKTKADDKSRDVSQALKIHAEIYRLADKLGIQPLKVVSTSYFVNALGKIDDVCFAGAIEVVHKNSSSDSSMLRSGVTDLCLFNHPATNEFKRIVKVMKEHEPTAWNIACNVAAAYKKQQDIAISAGILQPLEINNESPDCQQELGYVSIGDIRGSSYDVTVHYGDDENCDEFIEFRVDTT